MVVGLLFKWEDSPALSHHCGFCKRPLNHPGARASCFGPHSEPCHRYHQAMFMRGRAHTCHYCHTIDEAHHRRHKKIARAIRDVYESCGEFYWDIVPEERSSARGYDADEATDRTGSEDTPSSKRERKDAKSLARAAGRSRVISQDDVVHVDSVIHSSDSVSGGDGEGPCNSEEMEEIDRHLRYQAHVYNSQRDRRALKRFARLPDVDVDFEAEMERILEAVRISELLTRNTRNRGLQGRDLKTFQTLVHDLKKMLVDDLVSVKHDNLETRMRRAGYLRYVNKTAHGIVESRYADKDWKTGERIFASTSDSSGVASPVEEDSPILSTPLKAKHRFSLPAPKHGPDLRHLEKTHLRVNGDDGLGQKVIEPYHAPLLAMPSISAARKPAVQLKVVTQMPTYPTAASGGTAKKPRPIDDGVWQTVLSSKKPPAPSVKPDWGITVSGRSVVTRSPSSNPWRPDACEIPDLRSLRVTEVQPADATSITTSQGPDRFVISANSAVKVPVTSHPAVSQKKTKKHQREARRKAKKAEDAFGNDIAEEDHSLPISGSVSPNEHIDATLKEGIAALFSTKQTPIEIYPIETELRVAPSKVETASEPVSSTVLATTSLLAPLLTTQNDKHINWTKFKRRFIVDQLSSPCLQLWSGCSHGTSCIYEANGVIDCPFHEPHCACADPILDQCYLVYPCDDLLSSGPYNRLRGEKLLALYQKEEHFKGRIMLVENDLLHYFVAHPIDRMPHCNPSSVPTRLMTEYADVYDGYKPGPLMEQEKQFDRLWAKNNIIKRKLSRESLSDVQRQKFETKDTTFMCYCHDEISENGLPRDVVECAHRDCTVRFFHRACVKNLGVDKVSRWFCTTCQEQMRLVAHKTLRDLGHDDVPNDEENIEAGMEKLRKQFQATDAQMEKLRSRLAKTSAKCKMACIMAVGAMTAEAFGQW